MTGKPGVYHDFARRLRAAMLDKGWNQSDLVRHASKYVQGRKMGRDSISRYLKGSTKPQPLYLDAISKALGVGPDDLMPGYDLAVPAGETTELSIQTVDADTAWIRLNQRVPIDIALQIAALLRSVK